MRHRHHDIDADDHDEHDCNNDDDYTWALKVAYWLLAVLLLGFMLGGILLGVHALSR